MNDSIPNGGQDIITGFVPIVLDDLEFTDTIYQLLHACFPSQKK